MVRGRQVPQLLHIGFGAFARAHVLPYFDQMNRMAGTNWRASVARIHSGLSKLEDLARTDYRYHVIEIDNGGHRTEEVTCIAETLHPKRDGWTALVNRIASPDLELVTLTITEKGYCSVDGGLDHQHPVIGSELAAPGKAPQSVIGLLVHGLSRRAATGGGPLTILSCDNLPGNGALLSRLLCEHASLSAPNLGNWLRDNVATPSSMVDRIVPAMDASAFAQARRILGFDDPNVVFCEPFRQWVVEAKFARTPPPLERAGGVLVSEVAPFEEMKLRMLNGSHSFLAWFGKLLGHQTISECMENPLLQNATNSLMRSEQAKSLNSAILRKANIETDRYADTLLHRFRNRHLRHRCAQIAIDSSQKLPQRLLDPIREHLKAGRSCPVSFLAVAGWMRYCAGRDEAGRAFDLNDPLSGQLRVLGTQAMHSASIRGFLELKAVFPRDLVNIPEFRDLLDEAYQSLRQKGVVRALEEIT